MNPMPRSALRSLAAAAALFAAVTADVSARAEAPPALSPLAAPPWLGVTMNPGGEGGVAVLHVVRGSPAEKAGMRTGDKIVAIDGAKTSASGEVTRAVGTHRSGDTVNVDLDRAGTRMKLPVMLATRPSGDDILRMDLVGAFAPAWQNVTPLAGAPASLAQLRGKVVVVDFWASWCGPCRALAPRLSALKGRFGAQGLSVVGITTDEAEKAAVFAERNQMRYPTVIDTAGDTSKTYGITGLPTMLLLDKRGVVREVFVGFDPTGEAKLEALVKTLLAEPAPSAPSTAAK